MDPVKVAQMVDVLNGLTARRRGRRRGDRMKLADVAFLASRASSLAPKE